MLREVIFLIAAVADIAAVVVSLAALLTHHPSEKPRSRCATHPCDATQRTDLD